MYADTMIYPTQPPPAYAKATAGMLTKGRENVGRGTKNKGRETRKASYRLQVPVVCFFGLCLCGLLFSVSSVA
jgi:hypothetical protein